MLNQYELHKSAEKYISGVDRFIFIGLGGR